MNCNEYNSWKRKKITEINFKSEHTLAYIYQHYVQTLQCQTVQVSKSTVALQFTCYVCCCLWLDDVRSSCNKTYKDKEWKSERSLVSITSLCNWLLKVHVVEGESLTEINLSGLNNKNAIDIFLSKNFNLGSVTTWYRACKSWRSSYSWVTTRASLFASQRSMAVQSPTESGFHSLTTLLLTAPRYSNSQRMYIAYVVTCQST